MFAPAARRGDVSAAISRDDVASSTTEGNDGGDEEAVEFGSNEDDVSSDGDD